MTQRALVMIDGAYKKVTAGLSAFVQANEMSDKTKGNDARKKALFNTSVAIHDYCKLVVDAIANKAVANDPFGIIYGKGMQYSWAQKYVDDALDSIRESDPETFSKVDVVMSKAVNDGFIKKWVSVLRSGVKLVVDSKGVKMISGLAMKSISWAKETVSDFIQWLKLQWEKVFPSSKEAAPVPA